VNISHGTLANAAPMTMPRNVAQQGQEVHSVLVKRAVQCSSFWHQVGTKVTDAHAMALEIAVSSQSATSPS
jgi:hypothetical protein